MAPWFGPEQPYSQLNQQVGQLIDWYNIQFYSQGTAYTTCETLVTTSGAPFPGTSILEIVNSGVPASKVMMGKPAALIDVNVAAEIAGVGRLPGPVGRSLQITGRSTPANTNGFMDSSMLAQCLVTAVAHDWNAGFMVWEVRDDSPIHS